MVWNKANCQKLSWKNFVNFVNSQKEFKRAEIKAYFGIKGYMRQDKIIGSYLYDLRKAKFLKNLSWGIYMTHTKIPSDFSFRDVRRVAERKDTFFHIKIKTKNMTH